MKIIATTGVVGERGRVSAITLVIVALLCGLLTAVLVARHLHTRAAVSKAPVATAKPSDCDTPPAPAPVPAPAAPASASASSSPPKPAPNFLTFAACSDPAKPGATPTAPKP